jgi:hypothetical protein
MTRLALAPVLALLSVVAGFLGGCESPSPTRPVFPEIRFTDKPPIRLDVAAVEVVDRFQPTFKEPNVEHLFPVTPARAAGNWARDRLQAANPGSERRARFVILDASARETELPRTGGVRGAFTTDQAERYDAVIAVELDILGPRGFTERSVTAKASRSTSVAEGITPNQREQAWYDLTRALMADLDRQLEQEIRANFNLLIL